MTKTVGIPDGPKVLVPEIGKELPTFSVAPGGKAPALRYHVPFNCRGPYRPKELANYNPQLTYRTDPFDYMLCGGFTAAGERCLKRAVNRAPVCNSHGGRLHPLDKVEKETEEPSNDSEAQALSRYKQYLAGQLSVDDLDDEELACGGFRASNGSIFKPRNVPRELMQAFNKAIFERATQELRGNTVAAAKTLAEIMRNPKIEPDIRLKAASIMLDRNLGKAPQVVALTGDKGFEEIFSDIFSGTRSESRANRDNIIDAESFAIPERSNDLDPNENDAGPTPYAQQPINVSDPNAHVVSDPPDSSPISTVESHTVERPGDARLFERNPAILAQAIEQKPFDYDLADHSSEIKKETRKRYASRALNVDLTSPDYPLVRERLPNGNIRHVDPKGQANLRPTKAVEKRRKTYTLSDFD